MKKLIEFAAAAFVSLAAITLTVLFVIFFVNLMNKIINVESNKVRMFYCIIIAAVSSGVFMIVNYLINFL